MPKTILIADDSPTQRRVLQKALAGLGYEMLIAEDGDEAERLVRDRRPDLVVLDVVMPEKTGFALCRELKMDPELADIPIIIVTSKDQEADRYWGERQGADEYLTKPFEPQALIEAVERHLAGARPGKR